MGLIKTVAWVCAFVIGFFVLAPLAAIEGSPWGVVFLAWFGFWAVVGLLAQMASPFDDF